MKNIYIPPSKDKIQNRPPVQTQESVVNPGNVLNHVQFVKTLHGTHEEVFSNLIRRNLSHFHGTLVQWRQELQNLLKNPL